VQIDDVRGSRAVDVGQPDAALVELIGVVEGGRVVHRHLGAEEAIAQIRPVADLAVTNAYQVGEAVAAHVGKVDGQRVVGERQTRAFVFFQRPSHALGPAEAFFAQRGVPDEGIVFSDQHVGAAVTIQIEEPEIGVAGVAMETRRERAEALPAFLTIMFVQARHGPIRHHQIGPAVAGKVHEPSVPTGYGEIRFGSDELDRGQPRFDGLRVVIGLRDRAEVALVEPSTRLLGENARETLAVQIDPLISRGIDTGGQILAADGLQFENLILDDCLAVLELEGRQRLLEVGRVFDAVA
jgi:hypothetical protein